MRLVLVAGARPNFVKIAPLLWELERRSHDVVLVHSGQHYDAMMSDVFFDELGIRTPDHNLEVGSGSHAEQTAAVMAAFEPLVRAIEPDVVVVVGDVNSTVACSLVTAKLGPRIAHVEAGLRSRDWSMPEEVNRVVTDRLSDHLLAPSRDAADNLRDEGYRPDQISLVGNVMVDTLLTNLERAEDRFQPETFGIDGTYGLVTLHRPANVDDPVVLDGLLDALRRISAELPLVFPAHPRTRQRLDVHDVGPNVTVVDPVGYLDAIALQKHAALVLTDSGGIQEESTILGVPCLTARPSTERPITVSHGTNRVVGTDPEAIVSAAHRVLSGDWVQQRPELWDGRASERIVDVLEDTDGWGPDERPTAR